MNNCFRKSILLFFAFLIIISGHAQITLERSFEVESDSVRMIVRVENFEDISAFQFGIDFDSTVLSYERHAFPPIIEQNAQFNLLRKNHLRHVWSSGRKETFDDQAILYTIVFSILDNAQVQTEVKLSETEFPSEFASGATGLAVNHSWTGSDLILLNANSTYEEWGLEGDIQILGNPVADEIQYLIDGLQGRSAQIKIFSLNSGIIYQKEFVIQSNQLTRHIPIRNTPNGIYYLQLDIDKKHSKTIRLLLQN